MADALFRRGDLRLFLLGALEDGPKHGYELMRVLEDRFAGLYRPSAGSIYPRLGALVDAGLVTQTGRDYALTKAGRDEVAARRDELRELDRAISAGRRRAGAAVRADVRAAAAELRSQQRRVNRERRDRRDAEQTGLASLRVDLRVFTADVLAAARRVDADAVAVARLARVLDDARAAVLDALSPS